jgi:hypothetical protein
MTTFIEWIYWLQHIGLADVLIPFFLVFSVVFAVMAKTRILGEANAAKKFNVILALSMAFAVVVPHILWGTPDPTNPYLVTGVVDVVKLINNSLPQVAAVIIGLIMVMLLLGVFGKEWSPENSGGGFVVLIALLIIVYIFGTNAGWFGPAGMFPWWLWWLTDPNTQMLLITLIVFGVVVWLITRDEDSKNDKDQMKLFKDMFNLKDYGGRR